jgi:hypothetical protein
MFPVLKRIGIGFGIATLLVAIVGFTLPSTYTISRSIVIAAPSADVHAYLVDLNNWPTWTPWFKGDANLEVTIGSIAQGVGAHQSWSGNSSTGELTLTRCEPEWGIAFDMALDAGRRHTECTMRYTAVDGGTEVSWDMSGDNGMNIFARFASLALDPIIGPMFDEGLVRLKMVTESQDSTGTRIEVSNQEDNNAQG